MVWFLQGYFPSGNVRGRPGRFPNSADQAISEWLVYDSISVGVDIKNRLLDSVGEGRVEWFERIELNRVYYHMWNRWPVQVQCMKQGTQSQCTGTTQRGGMGWGGMWKGDSQWGTHVHLWLIHVNVWQKPP